MVAASEQIRSRRFNLWLRMIKDQPKSNRESAGGITLAKQSDIPGLSEPANLGIPD